MTLRNETSVKTKGKNWEPAKRILVIDPAIPRRLDTQSKPGHRIIDIDFTHDLHGACRTMCDGRYDLLILGPKPGERLLRLLAAKGDIEHSEFRLLVTALRLFLESQELAAFPGAFAAASATLADPMPSFALLCDPVNVEPDLDSLSVWGAAREQVAATLQRYMRPGKIECGAPKPESDNSGVEPRLWLFPVIHQSRVEALFGLFPRPHLKGLPARLEALRALSLLAGSLLTSLRNAEQLRRRNREMELCVQIRAHLESNLCHECRSLLSVVRGYSRQILEGRAGVLSDLQRRYLGAVLRNTNKLLDLVCYSIPFTLEQPLQVGIIDLREIWQSSLGRLEQQVAEKGLHIKNRFCSGAMAVAGDWQRLSSAFDVLAGNCVERAGAASEICADCAYGPEGEITFRVLATGVEISPPELEMVFEHSFVPNQPGQQRTAGLPLVRDIVWLHGGQIAVTSLQGAGTMFSLTLPPPCPPSQSSPGPGGEAPR